MIPVPVEVAKNTKGAAETSGVIPISIFKSERRDIYV
jgi:hypothetical protein